MFIGKVRVRKLEWYQKPNALWWVCENHPLGECRIKRYAASSGYDLYAPGFYGPGNKFEHLEMAMMAAQEYLDNFVRDMVTVEPIQYTDVEMSSVRQMKDDARFTKLYEKGDLKFVLVQESDLMHMERI